MRNKKKIINIFSIITILLGLIGAMFSFAGILVINSHQQYFNNIHNLGTSAASSLEKIADLLQERDETSQHILESINTTKNTLSYTSEISYDSGIAFNEVAGMVGFEILGFKPFVEAEDYFADIGNNLIDLSEELSTAQHNLKTNVSDIETIRGDLATISAELKNASSTPSLNSCRENHYFNQIFS